ncbi:pitrilysin family protein [Gorillibacterium sp. CAU 1737]|uniref:M16 family metallopeptidase n=1 Tax=Gorillibacterium sp. CAU 1737 TaxID=3140362 RepID=UPI0032608178
MVEATRFANGLQAFLSPRVQIPSACFAIAYKVGSASDPTGWSGLSHFLEHMMFKGTPPYPKGMMQQLITNRGGRFDALTSTDFTLYFSLVHRNDIEIPIQIEADRMRNMQFDPSLIQMEKEIILTERAGASSSPSRILQEAILATAFENSSSGHLVIGSEEDIKKVTKEALEAHYHRYYQPNNAIVSLVGNFEPTSAEKLLEQHLGELPIMVQEEKPIEPGISLHPPHHSNRNQSPRRLELTHPRSSRHLAMAWRSPGPAHPDAMAAEVINILLCGAPSLINGGAKIGVSSGILFELVEKELLLEVNSNLIVSNPDNLLMITCTLSPHQSFEEVESYLTERVEMLKTILVPQEALTAAIRCAEKQHAMARSDLITDTLGTVKSIIRIGDTASWMKYSSTLHAVTPEEIRRVAQRCFQDDSATIVHLLPSVPGIHAPHPVTKPSVEAPLLPPPPSYQTLPSTNPKQGAIPKTVAWEEVQPADSSTFSRKLYSNGMTSLVYRLKEVKVITIRLSFEAGSLYDPADKDGLSRLTAFLLQQTIYEGTPSPDHFGIQIELEHTPETVAIAASCTVDMLPLCLQILADALLSPSYKKDTFDQVKELFLYHKRYPHATPWLYPKEPFLIELYPNEHPLARCQDGNADTLSQLQMEDVYAFHLRYFAPAGCVLAIVGDVSGEAVEELLARSLFRWPSQGESERVIPPEVDVTRQSSFTREHRNVVSTLTELSFNWLTVSRTHPDFLPLNVLATLLGKKESAFAGRLSAVFREQYGLSYYQHVQFPASGVQVPFRIIMGVNGANTDRSMELLHQEIASLQRTLIRQEELEAVLSFMVGHQVILWSDASYISEQLIQYARHNLGMEYRHTYPILLSSITPDRLCQTAQNYFNRETLFTLISKP